MTAGCGDDDLARFLPYLLTQAAEACSQDFQALYKARYGMLRTEWRVLFHLGLYGPLSATQIRTMAGLHKTKVSRAVAALEAKRHVQRAPDPADRRVEWLSLSDSGRAVFEDLRIEAARFEARLLSGWPEAEIAALRRALIRLGRPTSPATGGA
jgi:DNA-binding MarR family transcriptional regulator